MPRLLHATPALLLLGALSCGDAPLGPLEPCTAPVTMTVTSIPQTPRVRWTPRCGASQLSIASPPSTGYGGGWAIRAGTNLIPPDVRFGVVPEGTVELAPPPTFIPAGVGMSVMLRDADGNVLAQGFMTF